MYGRVLSSPDGWASVRFAHSKDSWWKSYRDSTLDTSISIL